MRKIKCPKCNEIILIDETRPKTIIPDFQETGLLMPTTGYVDDIKELNDSKERDKKTFEELEQKMIKKKYW